jgi:hypothetical protein
MLARRWIYYGLSGAGHWGPLLRVRGVIVQDTFERRSCNVSLSSITGITGITGLALRAIAALRAGILTGSMFHRTGYNRLNVPQSG